jgi:hypothetical protein
MTARKAGKGNLDPLIMLALIVIPQRSRMDFKKINRGTIVSHLALYVGLRTIGTNALPIFVYRQSARAAGLLSAVESPARWVPVY